jgi:outer membrane protein TolC
MPPLPAGRAATQEPDDTRELLQRPLDANAAVRIALLHNRELRARLRELGVDRGRLLQAGLLQNPLLEVEVAPERQTRVEVRAEYDVMSFVLTPLHKKAAQNELEAARLDAAGDVVALGYEVRRAVYALQGAEQALGFAQRLLDALAAGRDAAEALLAAGNVAPLEASQQIAAFERARITVAKLELEVVERREELQRLLGLHGTATEWSVMPELQAVPEQLVLIAELEKHAIEANLDLAAAKKSLEAIARRTGIARTEGWLPHLDLDVHALVGNTDSVGSPYRVRWGGGGQVAIPVFDRQQGVLRQREAEFDSWLERYQGIAIDVRSAAREMRARVTSAHRRARQYLTIILPAQNTVVEQTQLQYNAMQIGVFQLLEARRMQLDVALEYAETLRDYWSAAAELDALVAGKLVGAHAAHPESGRMSSRAEQGGL